MLKKTPVLSYYANNTLKSVEELVDLYKSKDTLSTDEFNCKVIKVMTKDKIVSEESIDYLESHGKIKRCE